MRNVLIADDHEVTRRGLREILTDAFGNQDLTIAEASDAAEAIAAAGSRKWDLILLDILMPSGNVLDVLAAIRSADAEVPVLVLTAATELEYVPQTMQGGANGLVHKHRAAEELVKAVEQVLKGGTYLHPETAAAIASHLKEPPSALHKGLSEREMEVFLLIARGRAIKEVAGDLGLSEKTVATYLARIREKTGLTSLVDIARYAMRHGLVD